MDPDDRYEPTIEDLLIFGEPGFLDAVTGLAEAMEIDLSAIDQEQLAIVRAGGHRVQKLGGRVWIEVYRTGRSYGLWRLECSPEGHMVRIDHFLPRSYLPDGSWDISQPSQAWTCTAADWRQSPAGAIEALVGKTIARQAAPLLPIPSRVAPDALA